jgi:hypothetical protein
MNFKFIQEARRTCVISYRVDFFDRGRPGADMGLGRGLKHLLIDFLAQLLDIGPNCTGPSTESTRPADAVRQDRKRSRGHGPRISASGGVLDGRLARLAAADSRRTRTVRRQQSWAMARGGCAY